MQLGRVWVKKPCPNPTRYWMRVELGWVTFPKLVTGPGTNNVHAGPGWVNTQPKILA